MHQGTDLQFKLRDGIDPQQEVEVSSASELLLFSILLTLKRLRTWLERDAMPELKALLSQRNKGGGSGTTSRVEAKTAPPSLPEKKDVSP